jgi:hypothetical protein
MTDDNNSFLPDKIQHYETFVNEVLKSKLKYFKATVEKMSNLPVNGYVILVAGTV